MAWYIYIHECFLMLNCTYIYIYYTCTQIYFNNVSIYNPWKNHTKIQDFCSKSSSSLWKLETTYGSTDLQTIWLPCFLPHWAPTLRRSLREEGRTSIGAMMALPETAFQGGFLEKRGKLRSLPHFFFFSKSATFPVVLKHKNTSFDKFQYIVSMKKRYIDLQFIPIKINHSCLLNKHCMDGFLCAIRPSLRVQDAMINHPEELEFELDSAIFTSQAPLVWNLQTHSVILLMAEILHHLGCLKPCK